MKKERQEAEQREAEQREAERLVKPKGRNKNAGRLNSVRQINLLSAMQVMYPPDD